MEIERKEGSKCRFNEAVTNPKLAVIGFYLKGIPILNFTISSIKPCLDF